MAALLVGCLVAASCGGSGSDEQAQPTTGPVRTFAMGISSLPRELNAEAYVEAFELAGEAGEMVLIRRTPPWAEFLPGGSVSDATADTTAAEIAAVDGNNLDLFFAIDPTDAATGRDRLSTLPASHEGRGFDDPEIRSAFLAYAEYIAINYRPDYLALGVEMNLYIARDEERIAAFASLYEEAYGRIKEVAPETQITVTMQYEDMQSLLPTEDRHFADWALFERLDASMDVAALSTYPGLVFNQVGDIPANYYSQLRGFTDKPIVIAETGFPSEPSPPANTGSPEAQEEYVGRVLGEADDLGMPFIIWFAAWDPSFAEGTAFSSFRHIGLIETDGTEKPSWGTWSEEHARPLDAE